MSLVYRSEDSGGVHKPRAAVPFYDQSSSTPYDTNLIPIISDELNGPYVDDAVRIGSVVRIDLRLMETLALSHRYAIQHAAQSVYKDAARSGARLGTEAGCNERPHTRIV
jgi:hypothetical protein